MASFDHAGICPKCSTAIFVREFSSHVKSCTGTAPLQVVTPFGDITEPGVLYHPSFDRQQAETFLLKLPFGFYVLRRSSRPHTISLSYRSRSLQLLGHLLVERVASGSWVFTGEPARFDTLRSLLDSLPYQLFVDVDVSFALKSHWRADFTKADAEQSLRNALENEAIVIPSTTSDDTFIVSFTRAGVIRHIDVPISRTCYWHQANLKSMEDVFHQLGVRPMLSASNVVATSSSTSSWATATNSLSTSWATAIANNNANFSQFQSTSPPPSPPTPPPALPTRSNFQEDDDYSSDEDFKAITASSPEVVDEPSPSLITEDRAPPGPNLSFIRDDDDQQQQQ